MKRTFLTIALAIITTFSFSAKPHIDNVRVNAENSTIKWIGSKVASSHEGTVNIQKGMLMIDHGTLVGGQFSIDMTSISNTDMETLLCLSCHLTHSPEVAPIRIQTSAKYQGSYNTIV